MKSHTRVSYIHYTVCDFMDRLWYNTSNIVTLYRYHHDDGEGDSDLTFYAKFSSSEHTCFKFNSLQIQYEQCKLVKPGLKLRVFWGASQIFFLKCCRLTVTPYGRHGKHAVHQYSKNWSQCCQLIRALVHTIFWILYLWEPQIPEQLIGYYFITPAVIWITIIINRGAGLS